MKPFYYYLRPIVFFIKVIGLFPIENICYSDPVNLKYRIFSFTFLYTVIIFNLQIFLMYIFSGFIFVIKTYIHKYEQFLVYIMTGRAIICFLFCGYHSKKLPKLIRLLDTFDRKKINILIVKEYNKFLTSFIWIIIPLMFCLVFLYISIEESSKLIKTILPRSKRESSSGIFVSYLFGFLSTWQLVPLFLYFYFALKITCSFGQINNTLLEKKITGDYFSTFLKYDSDIHQVLSNIRPLHNMLSETVSELGKCYGSFIAIHQLCIIAVFVVNISISILKKNHEAHLLILTFLYSIIVLSVILVSDGIKSMGSEVINLLHGIPSTAISQKCQEEINIFLTQLIVRPIEVSAAGYFILDKSQTLAILSSVATYLIVMVQFLEGSSSCPATNTTV